MKISSIIQETQEYTVKNNIYSFVQNDSERPEWSKRLNNYFINSNTDLKMKIMYQQNKQRNDSPSFKRFFEYISKNNGIMIDLASGPSGYFSPLLDKLCEDNALIITDACPAVINAHSAACNHPSFYVFDIDLDKNLPFKNDSINSFSGNLLSNVDNYAGLLGEIYRCLKPRGRFAVIEMFFEHGCKTYEYLKDHGKVWASFETFVDSCNKNGFSYIDSEIIGNRKGKISDGDLFPLDDNDCSTDRIIYFEK